MLLNNIVKGGFEGRIYPVNPKVPEILGLRTYPALHSIDDEVDLAIMATPATTIPELMKQCAKKSVKGIIVISGGFSELGEEGKARQQEVLRIAREAGIPLLGPNCQGVSNPYANFCATWPLGVEKGNIALISQSGSVAGAFQCWAERERVGLSKLIDPGNRADIDEVELIEYLANDTHTKIIALYTEGLLRPREFLETARVVADRKRIIVLKGGRTPRGAKAALSHTRSLAGRDEIYSGAFKQAGAIRTMTLEKFYDSSKGFSMLDFPKEQSVLIVTTSGGLAILALDTCEDLNVPLAQLSQEAERQLRLKLGEVTTIGNPLDLATEGLFAQTYLDVADVVANEDVGVCLLIFGDPVEDTPRIVTQFKERTKMQVVVVYSGGGELELRDKFKIHELGIPVYSSPERAIKAIANLLLCESKRKRKAQFSSR
jgi:acyl-CoA synthetase (NDP forming)